jgi:ankyrin repeat protein
VNLQILALCEEPTASCVREALKKLPKDLKETYDRIIERTQTNESNSRIAQSVLSWLLSAQEPCSLSTILQGLAVGPGEDKFDRDILRLALPQVLDCCKNLIVNDSNTQNLRFAHFSVQEYLLGNPKFKEGSINHATMAEICLKVLLYHHSESKSRQEIGFLMKYAIKHWATHVRLSGSPPQSTLYERCIEFLKPSTAYNLWVSAAKEEDDPFKVSETTFVSPFWVACYYRLCDFFNVETSSEKILNEVNHRSWTPLLRAAEKGRDQVVKLLLQDCRTDVNWVSYSGRTPLLWAAEKGYDKVARLLLEDSRTDVNIADTDHGRTPLLWAVEKGHDRVVQLLLWDSRIDVNRANKHGRTPLSLAAGHGHDKVVELLLGDSRTDVNIADTEYCRTPISWAVARNHDKVVELLLGDSRTDVSIADNFGLTALSCAARHGHDKVVELLLGDSRIDVNRADKHGRTQLSWAAWRGHDKVVELLLRNSRIDVNIRDDTHGRTPLSWAAEGGHDKVVELLLRDSRIDVNRADKHGLTPLSWARESNHKEVVRVLLSAANKDSPASSTRIV